MRALRVAALAAAVLGFPALASAQTDAAPTDVYLCTPDGQVVRQIVNASGTAGAITLWYTGNRGEAFDDCVVGPDGWLYISSGASVLRLSLTTPTAPGAASVVSLVGSPARGLAFNVTTLYVNTATTGIYTLVGVPAGSGPLTFGGATQLVPVTPDGGHGITFDVLGNLVLSSGTEILRAPVNLTEPFYTTAPSNRLTATNTIFGTAINTCGETVFADKGTRRVRALSKDAQTTRDLATFTNPADYPIGVEVDSNNNLYVVTGQNDTGATAKLWVVPGNLANNCAAATPSPLVDLSSLLSGPSKLRGLKSARALGIAVSPTDAELTAGFNSGVCSNLFDFGYHSVRLTFADCSTPFSVTVKAFKSMPSDVIFASPLDPNSHALRYSPLGGFAVQYVLNDPAPASSLLNPFPYNAQYRYAAQETLGTPGVARALDDGETDPFSQNTIQDFWDFGLLDPFAGDRGNDFSKRVLFNAPLAPSQTDCTISLADWEEPFITQQPLFKVGQNVKIAFTATDSTGVPCGGGGTMRVSILRTSPAPLVMQVTQSSGNAQTGNVMSNQGDRYWFNLDTTGFGTGDFQVTIWGDKIAPTTRTFTIGQ